ncbi:DUF4249 domain-containing protein [Mucilaginibacter angelicae]|uniref:DUF4249 domain-containing protein n=1 Tax=Mucilaginibacter angelicae TaxID=869718 RepID=A0ABV6LHS2_9SPHI
MKIVTKHIRFAVILSCFIWGCKKPYNPKIVNSPNSYLVVEGVINTGNDSTIVRLSKTVNISGNAKSAIVNNASVSVEAEGGTSYSLLPMGDGSYISTGLNLDITKNYRLHINTADNKEYASDYVPVKHTPPIDSIGFAIKNNQVQLYVNAHDITNNTRYYRWSYDETWLFHARYESSFEVDHGEGIVIPRKQSVYYCFAGDKSSTIVLGSSAKLTQDVIFQAPLTTIAPTSEKIETRYSILLKQYALTKEAYQFWENLKKNTEQLGSIFDAQPSQLTGNIHNLKDASEPVIGYISVTNIQSKRVFIDNADLPRTWSPEYPYGCGPPDTAFYSDGRYHGENTVKDFIVNAGENPVLDINKQNTIIGYTYSSVQCTDCTIRGVLKRPSFWKDR